MGTLSRKQRPREKAQHTVFAYYHLNLFNCLTVIVAACVALVTDTMHISIINYDKEHTSPLVQNLRHKKQTNALSIRIYIAFRCNVVLNVQINKRTKPAPSLSRNYYIHTTRNAIFKFCLQL
jgi:hypothetical protein